ncbi:hypothetical protein NDU88_001094 [Pleurodeles waltl]|uniref:Uncharacterized protein n=1 Tax=Pleurodeles waltl TaxID=8319 RepID=A0AAV7M015_PLEWA|nr:hypothetical protein NDU88_001094 [Pleurodeles waltl]
MRKRRALSVPVGTVPARERRSAVCSVPVPLGTAPAGRRGSAEHCQCQWVQCLQGNEEVQCARASATGYSACKGDEEAQSVLSASGYSACKGTRKRRACSVPVGTAPARGRGSAEHAPCQCHWVQSLQGDEEAQSVLRDSATGHSTCKGTRKCRACSVPVPLGTAPAKVQGSAEHARCHWVQRLQGDEEAQSMLNASATGYSTCKGKRERRTSSVPLCTAHARGRGCAEHAPCHWVQCLQGDEEAQSMLHATRYSTCNGTRKRRACSVPVGTEPAMGRGSAEHAPCQCHWAQRLQGDEEAQSMLNASATGYSACKGTRKRRACSVPVLVSTEPARGRGSAEHAPCQCHWAQRLQGDEEAQSMLNASATGYSACKGMRKRRACSVPVPLGTAPARG